MMVIGIDLGTTNSAVAYVEGDEPRIIPNDRGTRITPSVVALTESGEILVGESARNQAVVHAERTVTHVKRRMGEAVHLSLGERSLLPEEVSAEILKKLKKDAENYLGFEVGAAVITVPANFGEAQRKATIEAGRLAGLKVLRVLNEPTAAALSYAWRHPEAQRLVVYDLGGGTFDVTCLQLDQSEYRVRSTCGENKLGGIDFDALLRGDLVEHFEREYGFSASADPVLLQQISEMVERAKIELSSRETAAVALPFMSTAGQPLHLHYEATRTTFDRLIEPLINQTLRLTQQALDEAEFELGCIDALVLSGGSSRIPLVHRRLAELLGLKPGSGVNPDEVVALGAALCGHMMAEQQRQAGRSNGRTNGKTNGRTNGRTDSTGRTLTDVTPYTLGVEIDGGKVAHLVRRNTPLPVDARRIVTTIADMQESVEIHVLQGDGQEVRENRSLGRFLLSGIRPAPRGDARVEVSFAIDEDGIVRVSAVDTDSGRREHVTVRPMKDEQSTGAEGLRQRVTALAVRIRGEIEELELPPDFLADTQELLSYADTVCRTGENNGLREAEIALESVIEELIALREDSQERDREHA